MNPILAGVALTVIAGAIVVVSVRDARVAVLAMAVVLLSSAVLADPVAAPVGLAARAIGATLTAYLLWIAARDDPASGLPSAPTEGSRIGWPAEILIAGAAAIVGFAVDGLGAPALGPSLAGAAGFAVAALTVAPVLTGRDIFRVGLGLLLLMDAALLIRAALGGTPDPLEQLLTAGLLVAIAGAVAVLARTARADGVGGFAFATEGPAIHGARPPEAHPTRDPMPPLPGDPGATVLVAGPRTRPTRVRGPRPEGQTRPGTAERRVRTARLARVQPGAPPEPPATPTQPDLGLLAEAPSDSEITSEAEPQPAGATLPPGGPDQSDQPDPTA